VLYLQIRADFDYIGGTLDVSLSYRYTWSPRAGRQGNLIDGSVAKYGQYAYFGDAKGTCSA
jgi:hypothetical protein